jgi:hypothetical protein
MNGSKLHLAKTVNEPATPPIPASGRRRLAVVVALALTAGAAAALAVVVTAGGSGAKPVASTTTRPLAGEPPTAVLLPGAKVRGSAAVCRAARARLGAADVRTKVACVMAGYRRNGPAATISALESLPAREPVVGLNLGLAQLWAGRRSDAETTLRAVRGEDMYGSYGTLADNVLHPDMQPGYPLWVAPPGLPGGSVAELQAKAAADPNQGGVWLALAEKLQGTDRAHAIADARRAQALLPTSVTPRIAVAVLAFDKDNPSASFGVLGPLTQQAPGASIPELRFHLGMLLLWIKQSTDALAQWRQVVQRAPGSPYGRIAARLLQQQSGQ